MCEKILITLGALAPTLLVIVTFIYVIITRNLVKESKRLREEQYRPRVVISYKILRGATRNTKKQYVHLLVRNIGTLSAFNIKFKIESDILKDKGDNLISEISFIKRPIPYLPPEQTLKWYLFNVMTPPKEIDISKCKGKVSYSDTPNNSGKIFEENFDIDFSYMKEAIFIE